MITHINFLSRLSSTPFRKVVVGQVVLQWMFVACTTCASSVSSTTLSVFVIIWVSHNGYLLIV